MVSTEDFSASLNDELLRGALDSLIGKPKDDIKLKDFMDLCIKVNDCAVIIMHPEEYDSTAHIVDSLRKSKKKFLALKDPQDSSDYKLSPNQLEELTRYENVILVIKSIQGTQQDLRSRIRHDKSQTLVKIWNAFFDRVDKRKDYALKPLSK